MLMHFANSNVRMTAAGDVLLPVKIYIRLFNVQKAILFVSYDVAEADDRMPCTLTTL